MSLVICCPHCQKKLAVKDELKGKTLACPQCKGRFTAPDDEPVVLAKAIEIKEPEVSNGEEMSFLDDLGAATTGAPKETKAKAIAAPSTATAPASKGMPPVRSSVAQVKMPAQSSPLTPDSGATRRASAAAKKAADQKMMLMIGGGIAAAVIVLAIIGVVVAGTGSRATPKKDLNIRFGLAESQRKVLFENLIKSVDDYGTTKACFGEWQTMAGQYKLTMKQLGEVLDEGFKSKDWPQPAMNAQLDAKNKLNRIEWMRTRNETKRDPILAMEK